MNNHLLLENSLPSRFRGLLANTTPPYFICGTKALVWQVCLTLMLLIALTGLGFVIHRIIEGKAEVPEWIVGMICLPFLITLLQPKTWIRPIWLIMDTRGMYFFGSLINKGYTFLPWHEVSAEMSIERIGTGRGLTKGIVIRINGDSSFWQPAKESQFMLYLLQPVEDDGYRRLPLTGFGHNLKRSLATMSYLRQQSLSAGKHSR